MSETSVLAILASVGIVLAGTVTADASVLAQAVQRGEPSALLDFVKQYPESKLAPDALLLAADVTKDRLEDSKVSDVNPALSCKLSIKRSGDKAIVTWEIAGAVGVQLTPLGFKKGSPVPLKGEKTVKADDFLRVGLTVRDAAGNELQCSVILNTVSVDDHSSFDTLGSPVFSV